MTLFEKNSQVGGRCQSMESTKVKGYRFLPLTVASWVSSGDWRGWADGVAPTRFDLRLGYWSIVALVA